MPIRDLPLYLKPREKAWNVGIDSLSEIELLAILLRSGVKENDALTIARTLLENFQTLFGVLKASYSELLAIKGIGKIKALELKILEEIFSRTNDEKKVRFETKADLIQFAYHQIGNFEREMFLLVSVDKNDNLLFYKILYQGTKRQVTIEPQEVVAFIIRKSGHKFYCFHNHPSGDCRPSMADEIMTKKIAYYASLFELNFKGHIIITAKNNYHEISW